jgi:uncharacterized protein (DUF2164 family)
MKEVKMPKEKSLEAWQKQVKDAIIKFKTEELHLWHKKDDAEYVLDYLSKELGL